MPWGLRWAQAWLVACVLFVALGIAAVASVALSGMEARPDARAGIVRALGLSTLALEPAAMRVRAPEGVPDIDRRFAPALPVPGMPREGWGGAP
jgi:hypothetical protein